MLFPKWMNRAPFIAGGAGTLLFVGVIVAFIYFMSPYNTQVGYSPEQPVPYSHKLHAGDLGIDCRYCHAAVERSAVAMVPPTQTCMNCHKLIKPDSPKLLPVRESWATGNPVTWTRVHHAPDFVYFNHSIHVNSGVGCESCHGRIDQMERVFQAKPLNMAWCLDCHRHPEKFLRPKDQVTTMGYRPAGGDQIAEGLKLVQAYDIHPTTNCSGCHR